MSMNDFNPDSFQEDEAKEPLLEKKRDQRQDINFEFMKAQLDDLKSRRKFRWCVSRTIAWLMFVQLFILCSFLAVSFYENNITELKWLFVTLFGGILAETYFLARLIVKWLFQEVSYAPHCNKLNS